MSNKITLYHFTKRENLQSIFREGLKPCSKFNTLGSLLRDNASYFWLSPEDDAMGYKGNDAYECLQISVEVDLCMIANMDLISAAFVNFVMAKKNEDLYDYKKLVDAYDATAIGFKDYVTGLFRAPEAIVQSHIPPDEITIVQLPINGRGYIGNRNAYCANIIDKLPSLTSWQKIAIHDDATGLLHTYKQRDKDEFVTIENSIVKHM